MWQKLGYLSQSEQDVGSLDDNPYETTEMMTWESATVPLHPANFDPDSSKRHKTVGQWFRITTAASQECRLKEEACTTQNLTTPSATQVNCKPALRGPDADYKCMVETLQEWVEPLLLLCAFRHAISMFEIVSGPITSQWSLVPAEFTCCMMAWGKASAFQSQHEKQPHQINLIVAHPDLQPPPLSPFSLFSLPLPFLSSTPTSPASPPRHTHLHDGNEERK